MYKGDLIGLKLQGMAESPLALVVNEHTQKFFQGSGIKQYVTQKYTEYNTTVSNSIP